MLSEEISLNRHVLFQHLLFAFTYSFPLDRNSDPIKSLNEVLSCDHEAEDQMLRMAEQEEGLSFAGDSKNIAAALISNLLII